MWHGFFPPLLWKQLDLLIALLIKVTKKHQLTQFNNNKSLKFHSTLSQTHIMLMEAAIVYPIATPKRLAY